MIRVEPHGNITVLADRFEGRRLNSPNDLVYRSDGTLFFTDPPFGLPDVFDDPARSCRSAACSRAPDGRSSLVTDELEGPNGLAFSPDERYLYVGNWDLERKVVMRYELGPDGRRRPRRLLFDMTDAAGRDAIDGLKVDIEGNVYVCGPGGIWILSPDGVHLGTAAPAGSAAQPRLGRRRRADALHHRADQRLPHSTGHRRHPTRTEEVSQP